MVSRSAQKPRTRKISQSSVQASWQGRALPDKTSLFYFPGQGNSRRENSVEELTTPIVTEAPAAETLAAEAPFGMRAFAPLRYLDYRYLWSGTVLMSAGQWIQQVTLGWLLYDLTGSSVLLGALNGLRALPFLVAGPIAGVAADRTDRRRWLRGWRYVLLVTGLARAVLVASGSRRPWHLLVSTLLTALPWPSMSRCGRVSFREWCPKASS